MSTPVHAAKLHRRCLLTATAITLGGAGLASAAGRPAAADPHHFASGSLADAVVDAIRQHQLVGIGEEPVHGLQEHHDQLQLTITDPRLVGLVDDVVVEFANPLYQDTIDAFVVDGKPVSDADLRLVWRDTTQSPRQTWDNPVYEQFFRRLRAVNWRLPAAERIRVLAGDPVIDWSTITDRSQIPLERRDSYAASVINEQVLARGRRALVCYGGGHLFHTDLPTPSIASLVEQQTGVRMYTIMDLVALQGDPGGLGAKLATTARGTVITTNRTWLGELPAQDALPGKNVESRSNFLYCDVPLGRLYDAGLHLGRPDLLTESSPNPAIYLDSAYWTELQRRAAIQGVGDLGPLRQQQPAGYPPLEGAAAC